MAIPSSTIEQMQTLAKARGGTCLSTAYINAHTKLRWQCAEGHGWEASGDSVKRGSWRMACAAKLRAKKIRGTIQQMQALAREYGGECLSFKYVNANTKLRWRCAEGHEWERTPSKVKSGRWCSICGRTHRDRRRADAKLGPR